MKKSIIFYKNGIYKFTKRDSQFTDIDNVDFILIPNNDNEESYIRIEPSHHYKFYRAEVSITYRIRFADFDAYEFGEATDPIEYSTECTTPISLIYAINNARKFMFVREYLNIYMNQSSIEYYVSWGPVTDYMTVTLYNKDDDVIYHRESHSNKIENLEVFDDFRLYDDILLDFFTSNFPAKALPIHLKDDHTWEEVSFNSLNNNGCDLDNNENLIIPNTYFEVYFPCNYELYTKMNTTTALYFVVVFTEPHGGVKLEKREFVEDYFHNLEYTYDTMTMSAFNSFESLSTILIYGLLIAKYLHVYMEVIHNIYESDVMLVIGSDLENEDKCVVLREEELDFNKLCRIIGYFMSNS